MTDLFSALYGGKRDPYKDMLAKQALDTSPIASPWQGASRMAFALLAGKEQAKTDAEEAQIGDSMLSLPGMEGAAKPQPRSPGLFSALFGGGQPQAGPVADPGGPAPAPIRYNNPGAQYPGPSASANGSTGFGVIGGGHKIAKFDTPEDGAAAQFHLLNRKYAGMPLGAAITEWSGKNSSPAYIASVAKETGLDPSTVITPELLRSPQGVALAQSMAKFETGRPFPMSPEQWQTAQARVFGGQGGELPPGATPAQYMVLGPGGMQPAGPAGQSQARTTPQIPLDVQQKIATMAKSGNPVLMQQAQALYQQYAKPREEFRPLTDPGARARAGISPEDKNPYQQDAQGKISAINPQPFAVNVNNQQESEFNKESGKLRAKRFDDLAGEAPAAKQMMADIQTLRDLGPIIQTGKGAEIRAAIGPYAQALGIDVKGLDEIQAYEAIVNRVAPNLRVKGSGAQSDMELRNFLKSLPSLGNTPEGNEMVSRTMQGLYQNKLRAAEIGADALDGTITRKEAEKLLRELPDPMEEWRKESQKKGIPAAASSGFTEIDGVKIRKKQ